MKRIKTADMVLCALFAALTAVLSQIVIPVGPIPINLATLSVFLSGALLGGKYGPISQSIYVLLGAVGAPVFAMLSGGIGVVLGPTGGYIIGYIAAAWVVGFMIEKMGTKMHILIISMIFGFFVCVLFGTCWFMYITKTDLVKSLMLCVLPFLIGDSLKIVLAAILSSRLYPVIYRKRGII